MNDKVKPEVNAMPEETVEEIVKEASEEGLPVEGMHGEDAVAAQPDALLEEAYRDRDRWRDKAYRAAAEAENMKKRAAADVQDARQFGVASFARDMLAVADNLARALSAPEGNEKALRDGVALTAAHLQSQLARHGIAVIAVQAGDPLNPDLHQAMSEVDHAEVKPGHIVQEVQAGFTVNGRLLRPAMVMVAKAADVKN